MINAPQPPSDLALQRQQEIYHQAIGTLRGTLPPPLTDTPEAWADRDRTAIAMVAALAPANAAEASLAAWHVATMAHAGECLREAVRHAADPKRAAESRTQAANMGREARGGLDSLLRLQTARQNREADRAARERDARTEQRVRGLMLEALQTMPPVASAARAAAPSPPPQVVPSPDCSERSEEQKRLERLRLEAGGSTTFH
jgi:hypothetical protein